MFIFKAGSTQKCELICGAELYRVLKLHEVTTFVLSPFLETGLL